MCTSPFIHLVTVALGCKVLATTRRGPCSNSFIPRYWRLIAVCPQLTMRSVFVLSAHNNVAEQEGGHWIIQTVRQLDMPNYIVHVAQR